MRARLRAANAHKKQEITITDARLAAAIQTAQQEFAKTYGQQAGGEAATKPKTK